MNYLASFFRRSTNLNNQIRVSNILKVWLKLHVFDFLFKSSPFWVFSILRRVSNILICSREFKCPMYIWCGIIFHTTFNVLANRFKTYSKCKTKTIFRTNNEIIHRILNLFCTLLQIEFKFFQEISFMVRAASSLCK